MKCLDGSSLLHQNLRSPGYVAKHKRGGADIGLVSWSTLPSNKAEPLMEALMTGPVAITVAGRPWSNYARGIFNGCNKNAVIDHAVLLVSYGKDPDRRQNYWGIQNSWGSGWGEGGYIRVLRHTTP